MNDSQHQAPDPGSDSPAAHGAWDRFCRYLIEEPVLGFRLDVSTMPFRDDDLTRMAGPIHQAMVDMKALEAGEVANPDEGRRVGHYWLRSPELAPQPALIEAIQQTRDRIGVFAQKVHSGEIHPPQDHAPGSDASPPRFRHLLLVGIGGSALGPQLLDDALSAQQSPLTAYYIDNTDPAGIDRTCEQLGDALAETLVLIVSKSGGTKETRNGMLEIRHALTARGLEFGSRAVAVTGEGSALERYARENGFLDIFPMWDWVGGRTSVMSAVGLLPAALQGFDIGALLEGARRMDDLTRTTEVTENPAAMMALMWYLAGNGHGKRDMVILPYRDRLVLLSRYLQQLVMESLGKELDLDGKTVNQGLLVYGNKGSTDQHAYVQQLREGPDSFFATFIEVLRDRDGESLEVEPGITSGDYLLGFLLGTRAALAEKSRGSITITIPEVCELSLGALIALFERAVGLYASLIHINAYHQPGVEAGKKAAADVLEIQTQILELLSNSGVEAITAGEVSARLGLDGEIRTVFHILEHLAANGRIRVIRSGPSTASQYATR
ncbi:glucose-6-phosphate isomerase [Candidatus Eisenbacteria bacterium]|uniref:Glucose-6-phosphate isomerase n=1 Tax=Eiseniibacteriota bacterium TaxID=2212470 RepID=A0ABV6YJ70_UNCEI